MESFIKLDKYEQCRLIAEILAFSAIGTEVGNLSALGRNAAISKIYISKNLSAEDKILLIHQSVTGFYENSIDLGKV